MTRTATAVIAVVACLLLASCAQDPRAVADGESLRGFVDADTGVMAFLGVPFAEPPVGKLRWAAPQPLGDKRRSRDVTAFAPACMQKPRILEWYRDYAEIFGAPRDSYPPLDVDEDCLYLNVWTPATAPARLMPVMVYVHGGSNNSGWSYEIPYHGQHLAKQGVVVVTIAYRLGAFGFLSHPDLGGEAVANFGLWDQVAALRWVERNIAAFGGDPDRVMVFGESAGAENILALLFAEPAAGLIDRAALHSTAGFGLFQPTLDDERRRGAKLAAALGVADSVDALRKVPADRLLDVYDAHFADHYHSPAIDGQLIRESTWDDIRHEPVPPVPIIIGTNADEWLEYVEQDASMDDVRTRAGQLKNIDPAIAMRAVAGETDPRKALDRLLTADDMLCPSQLTASRWNDRGGAAWNYYFTRVRDGDAGRRVGAFHGAEYTYVFGTNYIGMPESDVDRALTRVMMDYWTRFAATGDPNSASTPDWPAFVAPDFKALELGDVVQTIARPEAAMCASFDAGQKVPDRSFSNQATSQ
ncbi:MAG: carboxylesterase family protein [Woeseiaceae bacterium]|nr:carboxylesterase family protein [Woeseiaceae bacterium]